MKISVQAFTGIAPRINPRFLPEGGAQIAENVEAFGQTLKPLKGLSAAVAVPNALAGAVRTLYRGGQDELGDNAERRFWLSWADDVDVCRSQIAGDKREWTFFSGASADEGYAQATYDPIALGAGGSTNPTTGVMPANSVRLGMAAPTEPLTGHVNYVTPKAYPAKLTLTPGILAQFNTFNFVTQECDVQLSFNGDDWYYPTSIDLGLVPGIGVQLARYHMDQITLDYGLKVSVDGGQNYATVVLAVAGAEITPAYLAAEVNAQARINGAQLCDASVDGDSVIFASRRRGGSVRFVVRWGASDNYMMYSDGVPLSPAAVQNALGSDLRNANNSGAKTRGSYWFTTKIDGANLVLESVAHCSKTSVVGGYTVPWSTPETCATAGGAWIDGGGYCSISGVIGEDACAEAEGVWTPPASLSLKWGDATSQRVTAYGTTEDKGAYESRVYIFTWVKKFYPVDDTAEFEWESAPSPPSEVANVYADSTVLVQRRGANNATIQPDPAWSELPDASVKMFTRVYRATAGQYLLVAEGDVLPGQLTHQDGVNEVEFIDDKKASELGTVCPSVEWQTPPYRPLQAGVPNTPKAVQGLINLPNGNLAGFLDRDIAFCEPYRPFAWPESYLQTLDFPVVGLGRMDTTLAVLTKGSPYFVQGSHPANMVAVKSDLEQACVSKRSIVSMNGSVLYASPDGLIVLTPGGSSIITDSLYRREQWQELAPDTIHAYGHDNKYVAFLGATGGGFVVDLASKQFIKHTVNAAACYHDPRNDILFVAPGDGTIRKWDQGALLTGKWRSKIFSQPQMTGYSCGQLEAMAMYDPEQTLLAAAYPVTLRIYVDGLLFHTQTVTDSTYYSGTGNLARRNPFRLPPLNSGAFLGRDWEIEIDVRSEIFNLCLAQSPSEIATA